MKPLHWVHGRLRLAHDWLLPRSCALCGAEVSRARDFCDGCERALPVLLSCCSCCATPLALESADDPLCGACQQHVRPYALVRAPFRYDTPIDRLIQGAKYAGRLDWLALLGRRLIEHVESRAAEINAVTAVPLHTSRLRERGYNQSLELARALARHLRLPLLHVVRRVRATAPQAELAREDRHNNVRNAFAATHAIDGLRLALVDDVMTSGATVEAVSRCLRKAGAASVEVWVVARA